ncbi:hypothetical protein SAMN06265370_101527 [Puniceibacterium sediminis]|uniref:Uncharacterized protein n=1 Tax=Puniceibacterium sediminis TaxID=1608407 RepID=A0A238V1P6_9RHOB|nr:hypothetical protein SAMN06265370_101527 [Puniceibacterium sediminis]
MGARVLRGHLFYVQQASAAFQASGIRNLQIFKLHVSKT